MKEAFSFSNGTRNLCLIVIFMFIMYLSGCSKQTTVPLPISPKVSTENQITIPFPYGDKFPGGEELWLLDRDTSNHFVLKVMFKDKEVAKFPIDGIGDTQATGHIVLGDKEYAVKTITLNSDQASGWVTLSLQ